MQKQRFSFRANIGLKDIVGRDLINSDNIAIVELIKNSKDAGSEKVEINFNSAAKENKKSQLIIQDFGQGMSLADITKKWLNIAYSEKKGENLKKTGAYAGSKGVGRFSCDRLGRKLDLYTKIKNGNLVWLPIDWQQFEIYDQDKEIGFIELFPQEITHEEFHSRTGLSRFSSGTVLVMGELRSVWSQEKLEGLKKELERFVIDPSSDFEVFLHTEDFSDEKHLNGKIQNKIFERLNFRTTSIHSSISKDGKTTHITLRHAGNIIFEMSEQNSYKHLKNVEVSLFYLNQPSKAFFRRETGYRTKEFGSIFLFLNGFRIFPYGDDGDDWLKIDKRKAQGVKRYLGTRDVIGFVKIKDDESAFKPVSSREGVVINNAFRELASSVSDVSSSLDENKQYGFLPKILRKLEKFVVDGLDWDRVEADVAEENEEYFLKNKDVPFVNRSKHIISGLDSVITLRSPEKYIIDIELNKKYLFQLAKKENAAHAGLVEILYKKLSGVSVEKLLPAEKRDLSKLIERHKKDLAAKEAANLKLQEAAEKAAKDKADAEEERAEAERKLELEKKRRLFAEASSSLDYKHVLNMHHQIGLLAGDVLKRLDRVLQKNNRDPESVSKKDFIDAVEKSLFNVNKIRQASKFATKANFNLATNNVKADLVQFLEEYIESVCSNGVDWGIKIHFENRSSQEMIRPFKPIELTIVVDNILNNAAKAAARNLYVDISKRESSIRIRFADDGKGLNIREYKPDEFFERGITTTDGSGIGLYYVRQIVTDMGGIVKIGNNKEKGAFVSLEFEI